MPTTHEELCRALRAAYPSRTKLARMVKFGLGVNLNDIAAESADLQDTTFQLVTWAESHGKLRDLLETAHKQNPGNPELSTLCTERSIFAPKSKMMLWGIIVLVIVSAISAVLLVTRPDLDHYDFKGQLWEKPQTRPSEGAEVILIAPRCKKNKAVADDTGDFEFHCALPRNTPTTHPRIRVRLPGRPFYCADEIPLETEYKSIITIDERCHAQVKKGQERTAPQKRFSPSLAQLTIGLNSFNSRVTVTTSDGVALTSRRADECGDLQLDGHFLCVVDVPLGTQQLQFSTGRKDARIAAWLGDTEVKVAFENDEYSIRVDVPAGGLRVDADEEVGVRLRSLEIQMNHPDAQVRLWDVLGKEVFSLQSRDCGSSREGYRICGVRLPNGIYTIRFSDVFGFQRKIARRNKTSEEWRNIDTDVVFVDLPRGRGQISLRADYVPTGG